MKATGCSNKATLMTALSDLKNPKYAGKLGALTIEKHADGGYHVVKDDGRWITYTGGTQGMSASDAAELARKHPGANYRPVKHRDY